MVTKHIASPRISVTVTPPQLDRAIQSDSGGCLIADAIKRDYPHLIRIQVDMATIRITDPTRRARFAYLTPPAAQMMLLGFDQGWESVVEANSTITLGPAVKVTAITDSKPRQRKRVERRAELQSKRDAGTLTGREQAALAKLEEVGEVPSTTGPSSVEHNKGGEPPTVHGGAPLPQGPAHPNLLRGRNRHFGAKISDPGVAFREAVDEAVRERLNPTEPQLFEEESPEAGDGPPPADGPREARRRRSGGRRR